MTTMLMAMVLSAQAQRTISGTVVDSDQHEAVIQATIALLKSDSTMVANAVTNIDGKFQTTAPASGNYIIRVSYVGYKTLYKPVSVTDKPVSLGTLTISPDAIMLKETQIVKNQTRMYSKADTIV